MVPESVIDSCTAVHCQLSLLLQPFVESLQDDVESDGTSEIKDVAGAQFTRPAKQNVDRISAEILSRLDRFKSYDVKSWWLLLHNTFAEHVVISHLRLCFVLIICW